MRRRGRRWRGGRHQGDRSAVATTRTTTVRPRRGQRRCPGDDDGRGATVTVSDGGVVGAVPRLDENDGGSAATVRMTAMPRPRCRAELTMAPRPRQERWWTRCGDEDGRGTATPARVRVIVFAPQRQGRRGDPRLMVVAAVGRRGQRRCMVFARESGRKRPGVVGRDGMGTGGGRWPLFASGGHLGGRMDWLEGCWLWLPLAGVCGCPQAGRHLDCLRELTGRGASLACDGGDGGGRRGQGKLCSHPGLVGATVACWVSGSEWRVLPLFSRGGHLRPTVVAS